MEKQLMLDYSLIQMLAKVQLRMGTLNLMKQMVIISKTKNMMKIVIQNKE